MVTDEHWQVPDGTSIPEMQHSLTATGINSSLLTYSMLLHKTTLVADSPLIITGLTLHMNTCTKPSTGSDQAGLAVRQQASTSQALLRLSGSQIWRLMCIFQGSITDTAL